MTLIGLGVYTWKLSYVYTLITLYKIGMWLILYDCRDSEGKRLNDSVAISQLLASDTQSLSVIGEVRR